MKLVVVTMMVVALAQAEIYQAFSVTSDRNEWTGELEPRAQAIVVASKSDWECKIVWVKFPGTPLGGFTVGAWPSRSSLVKSFGMVHIKIVYADSSDTTFSRAAPYGRSNTDWPLYLTTFEPTTDVLANAVRMVVYVEWEVDQKTSYLVFGKTDLRELRKVANHRF